MVKRKGNENAHRASGSQGLPRFDKMVLDELDASFALAASVKTKVEELLLLEEVDLGVRRTDDGERGGRRGVELSQFGG